MLLGHLSSSTYNEAGGGNAHIGGAGQGTGGHSTGWPWRWPVAGGGGTACWWRW